MVYEKLHVLHIKIQEARWKISIKIQRKILTMRDDATVYLTSHIETLLKYFGRTDKPNDISDYGVGELVDQPIDELV